MEEAEKEKKIIIFIKVFHSKFHIIIPVVQLQTVINVCECVIEGVCWFLSFLHRRAVLASNRIEVGSPTRTEARRWSIKNFYILSGMPTYCPFLWPPKDSRANKLFRYFFRWLHFNVRNSSGRD